MLSTLFKKQMRTNRGFDFQPSHEIKKQHGLLETVGKSRKVHCSFINFNNEDSQGRKTIILTLFKALSTGFVRLSKHHKF